MITPEFPSALAFVGVRGRSAEGSLMLDDNNGERMIPEIYGGSTFWEHVHRYAFANAIFVRGKRVLDIASSARAMGSAHFKRQARRM